MKKLLVLFVSLFCSVAYSQVSKYLDYNFNPDTLLKPQKTNPIVFADLNFGGAGGTSKGLMLGASVNYSFNRHDLVTVRYNNLTDFDVVALAPFVPLPAFRLQEEIQEGGLLYGKRYVNEGHAFSFSVGVSYNFRKKLDYYSTSYGNGIYQYNRSIYVGVPFELTVKWFKKEKEPYHLYAVIPVGKPTSLGHSFGFKLFGNVSTTTFVGAGISWGWGWHKHY